MKIVLGVRSWRRTPPCRPSLPEGLLPPYTLHARGNASGPRPEEVYAGRPA